jgi:hypothetical protein
MSITVLATGLAISILLVVGALFIWSLVLSGFDIERAIERSTRSLSGLITGILAAGMLIGGEIVGGIVAVITAAPSGLINGLLGIVGYLSLSGIVSLQPETWGIMTILLMAAGIVLRQRAMEA